MTAPQPTDQDALVAAVDSIETIMLREMTLRAEVDRVRKVFADARVAVEHDLNAVLEAIAKNDPADESEVAELIRCHLDRWACWGPSHRHITVDRPPAP